MPKWTNKFNLPKVVVDLVTNDSYSKGPSDISITGLAKPPRMRVLEKLHGDKITIDVSQRIASLKGRAMHKLLESANASGLAEKRFYLEIEGITISGQLDAVIDGDTIQDYKNCPIRKLQNGVPKEFEEQLNSYAYMIKYGYTIESGGINGTGFEHKVWGIEGKRLQIVAFFKDWFLAGLKKDEFGNYPEAECLVYDVPRWSEEQQLAYLIERIRLHKAANKKLPLCSKEDRWATDDKYAVMVKGQKKSKKNHDSREDAERHAKDIGGYVEARLGKSIRCEDWCDVASVCSQWKNLKKLSNKTRRSPNGDDETKQDVRPNPDQDEV